MLDEKDLEFVEALRSLDVPRNVAMLITFLARVSEANSREIETATRLRQPEISRAMQILRENGWLTEHYIKGNGKGRPLKIYALRATIDEIINYYEAEKSRELDRTSEAIQKLKELNAA